MKGGKVSIDSARTMGNSVILSRGGSSLAERSKHYTGETELNGGDAYVLLSSLSFMPKEMGRTPPSTMTPVRTLENPVRIKERYVSDFQSPGKIDDSGATTNSREFVVVAPSLRRYDRITKNLYIGDIDDAKSLDSLNREGISHIVNCTDLPNFFPNEKHYLRLGLKDDPTYNGEDLLAVLEPSYAYIRSVIKRNPDAKILIHCRAGISRSASILIYALMRNGMSYREALERVRKVRPIVKPNPWYERQLVDVEKMGACKN
jgi:predicted protein tyrosine phosphatase